METDRLSIAPPTHIQKAAGKALISIRKAKLLYLSELVDQVFIGPDGAVPLMWIRRSLRYCESFALSKARRPSVNMYLPRRAAPSLSIPKVRRVTCKTLQGNTASRVYTPTNSGTALPASPSPTAQTLPVCRKSWGIRTKLSHYGCIRTPIRRA